MGTRSRFVAIAHCLFRTIDCPGLFLVAARYGEQLERLGERISTQHPSLLTPSNVDHRRDLEGTDQVFSGVLSEHDELLCLHGRLLCRQEHNRNIRAAVKRAPARPPKSLLVAHAGDRPHCWSVPAMLTNPSAPKSPFAGRGSARHP